MNKVVLLGRFTRDLELKYLPNEHAILKFSLAVNRKSKDKGVDFINCIAFGTTAEKINQYFKKGSLIAIIGRIQTNSYMKDDKKVFTFEVAVEEYFFTGEKKADEDLPDSYERKGKKEDVCDTCGLPFDVCDCALPFTF